MRFANLARQPQVAYYLAKRGNLDGRKRSSLTSFAMWRQTARRSSLLSHGRNSAVALGALWVVLVLTRQLLHK